MDITQDLAVEQIESIYEDLYNRLSLQSDVMYKERNLLEKTLKEVRLSSEARELLEEHVKKINRTLESFEDEKTQFIKQMIHYIFDNNIDLGIKEEFEVGEYNSDSGRYGSFVMTTFSSVLGNALYQILTHNCDFAFYYYGKKITKARSFIGKDKAGFVKTLNLYRVEGNVIKL